MMQSPPAVVVLADDERGAEDVPAIDAEGHGDRLR